MNMPRIAKALVAVLCGLLVISVGCSSTNAGGAAKSTIVAAQKGSLSVAVTGTGNLALSTSQDVAFQIAGYVAEVLVKEGESVKKGQDLAKLDTSEWDKQVKKLDTALVTAQRNLDSKQRALAKAQDLVTSRDNAITKAQRAVTSKENDIAKAQRTVTAKELAVRQAELDLQTTQDSLTQITDVKAIQDNIDDANFHIDFVKAARSSQKAVLGIDDDPYWLDQQTQANKELETAQQQLADILAGTSIKVTSNVALQVKKAQLQLELSQRALDEAKIAVDDAKFAVGDAQLAKNDADLAVKDAVNNKADAVQAWPMPRRLWTTPSSR
ncbi:MAG: biotin/lipoyl-binding protein [Dehalococcoidales bacterium]|nr:biotin/lipoyl-binding protein [Dehalococcoidales bacterium]